MAIRTRPQATKDKPLERSSKVETPHGGKARHGVTVACKHANGMRLRLHHEVDVSVPVMGGGTKVEKQWHQRDPDQFPDVLIHGTALRFGEQPSFLIVGGYALTSNVDAEFMDEWMRQNKNSDAVKNRIIFVQEDENDARSKAKEQASIRSGTEPLNMGMVKDANGDNKVADLRVPRALGGVSGVQTMEADR